MNGIPFEWLKAHSSTESHLSCPFKTPKPQFFSACIITIKSDPDVKK